MTRRPASQTSPSILREVWQIPLTNYLHIFPCNFSSGKFHLSSDDAYLGLAMDYGLKVQEQTTEEIRLGRGHTLTGWNDKRPSRNNINKHGRLKIRRWSSDIGKVIAANIHAIMLNTFVFELSTASYIDDVLHFPTLNHVTELQAFCIVELLFVLNAN